MKEFPIPAGMTKAEFVAHLKEMYAAEDFFTGVLGNRNSVAKPFPRRRLTTKRALKKAARRV